MKRKVYRERIEIIGSVLQAGIEPKTKRKLYEASYTNHNLFFEVYSTLLKTGDIVEVQNDDKTKYKTSVQGSEFLKKIISLEPHLKRFKRVLSESRT